MKNKRIWWVFFLTVNTALSSRAASYVAPEVVADNYVSDHGIQWVVPTYADYTWSEEWITYYTLNYNAGREKFRIQPDWNGVYVEIVLSLYLVESGVARDRAGGLV